MGASEWILLGIGVMIGHLVTNYYHTRIKKDDSDDK